MPPPIAHRPRDEVVLAEQARRLRVVLATGGSPSPVKACLRELVQWRPSMLKKLALISAVSAFAIGSALAQSPTPPMSGSPPAATTNLTAGDAQFIAAQKPDQWLARELKG